MVGGASGNIHGSSSSSSYLYPFSNFTSASDYGYTSFALEQAQPDGVGTIDSYGHATSSSFSPSSDTVMTPTSTDSFSSFDTLLDTAAGRDFPQTPASDRDSDSSSESKKPGRYICTWAGCTNKKVFKLKCKLK
jgi:hypothetical protein